MTSSDHLTPTIQAAAADAYERGRRDAVAQADPGAYYANLRDALADMTRQRDEAKEAMQVAVNVASRLTDMYQRERARVSRVEKLVWAASFYGARVIDLRDLRAALADRPTNDARKAREAAVSAADGSGVAGQGSDAERAGEGK